MTANFSSDVLTPEIISTCLSDYLVHTPAPELKGVRAASVLLPLILTDTGITILYTRRSELLKNHRGQVAFPGGGADPEDVDDVATALREANEEIGLPPEYVRILGKMPMITSSSRYNVTPIVGWIEKPFKIIANPAEVARVFTVPLDWISDPSHVEMKDMETPWGRYRDVVFFNEYDGETVWGFTGHLTVQFLRIIRLFAK